GRLAALAADRPDQQKDLALSACQANRLMVCGPDAVRAADVTRMAQVLLLPYCAKLVRCKWRRRNGCTECGLCEVGDAYRLAACRT
ncbi:MAG TPA: hypothetical protein VIM38_09005, partial [Alphaproteobacteria bacterium]